ncbi:hypothetical protein [Pirellula sp. SH-Sr6A]|uniref:hypothetical protein n=1 Tax=Pirellula sp. SH-Sr6A TaxID=1632865 RepID=UPI0011BACA4F|nr:hypothetical protein [Pirellula sp. SH-Sr6A]
MDATPITDGLMRWACSFAEIWNGQFSARNNPHHPNAGMPVIAVTHPANKIIHPSGPTKRSLLFKRGNRGIAIKRAISIATAPAKTKYPNPPKVFVRNSCEYNPYDISQMATSHTRASNPIHSQLKDEVTGPVADAVGGAGSFSAIGTSHQAPAASRQCIALTTEPTYK